MTLENLLSENQPDFEETASQSPEYQYMLSWCWNNIKVQLHLEIIPRYSQGPKVIPQNQFSIDINAFSCLEESLYYMISGLNSTNFILVVKLNNR